MRLKDAAVILALAVRCPAQPAPIFPQRPALPGELRAGGQVSAEIAVIEKRDLEILNATDFGVRCDGRTDDTKAANEALDAAWRTGKPVRFPAGECLLGHITLPAPSSTTNQTLTVRGAGTGYWFGGQNQIRGGTHFRFNVADGTDFMVASSTAFAIPSYKISDLSIIGPDKWMDSVGGAVAVSQKSGSGIKFVGPAVPKLIFHNVGIQGFYGNGTAALWVSGAEDSSLYDVAISHVNSCAHFSNAFNASTVVNFTCQAAAEDGVFITDSESLTWVGGLFQSNQATGLHIKGVVSSTFTSIHFENNDWKNHPAEGAIKIEAVYVSGCPTGRCLSNQNLVFTGNVFNAPTDRVLAIGGGPNGWNNSNITFMNGYMSGVRAPAFTLNEYSFNWRIVGLIGPSAVATAIVDSGAGNIVLTGNQIVALHDGIAVSATGDVNISRNVRAGGDVFIPDLKAKTGTRFVCVDGDGKLTSQIIPCSGT